MLEIVKANIDRYWALLKTESDAELRARILRLLDEEFVKLKATTKI